MSGSRYFIGVDVGTGSARAGVFDEEGQCLATGKRDIRIYRDHAHMVEQSSADIWDSVCHSVRTALAQAKFCGSGRGARFRCHMLAGCTGGRRAISACWPVGRSRIATSSCGWINRAVEQAERINALGHGVLRYVGGRISPEMETPKCSGSRKTGRRFFKAAWQFFDLADFLTWRATGSLARSTCTLACKWTYLAHENPMGPDLFPPDWIAGIGGRKFRPHRQEIVEPGTAVGHGLTAAAAKELGLRPAHRSPPA